MNQNYKKLELIVKEAAKAVFLNEKIPVMTLAVKARQLANTYPHDTTCVGMYNFLSKNADNSKLLISRGELREVYNKLYSNNNKFGSYFKEELGLDNQSQVSVMNRNPKENELLSELHTYIDNNFDQNVYSVFADELTSAFDKKPAKKYTENTAKLAQKSCARELNSIGFFPKKVSVVDGQSDVLICEATYDTPKGVTAMLIPVEICNEVAIAPSMFLSSKGFIDINQENVSNHIKITAGKSFTVNLPELLNKISSIKNKKEEIGEVEQIVRKASLLKGNSYVNDINSVLLKEIDPINPNVKIGEVEIPEELKSIANYLESKNGAAEFLFGKDAVESGRNLIHFELKKAGFNNPQVKILESSEDTITYGVSVNNKVGFKTCVKFNKKTPIIPSVIISNGSVYNFNSEGINKLITEENTDSDIVAFASASYDLKPSELVNNVRKHVLANDFDSASEALHVIKQSGDKGAYITAYNLFVSGLKGDLNISSESSCSHTVKHSSSQKLICAHTGLPVDKIYQDKFGNCQPLYRRGMEETSTEGVSTITSRIYFE